MRAIRINGEQHAIPSDREWRFRTQESDHRHHAYIITEYRFQPEPCNYVEIREMRQDIGFSVEEREGRISIDEWVEIPNEPLNKYLMVEPGQEYTKWGAKNPTNAEREQYYRYGTETGRMSAGMDMAATEKRFLASLAKPKNKKSRSKQAPRPMYTIDDPVKAVYDEYSSKPYDSPLPSFEEELLIDRTDQPFKAYYPKGYGQEEEEDMRNYPQFHAGTRVIFRHPRTETTERGTIVGKVPEMRGKCKPGQYLVATDDVSKYNSSHIKYTGQNHGIVVDARKGGMSEAAPGDWHAVPEQIGVLVIRSFIQDDVKFPSNATGRIVGDVYEGMVDVSWNFTNDNFHSTEDGAGCERHNIWTVPAAKLNMCLLDTQTKRADAVWPAASPGQRAKLKIGDLCVVKGRSVSVMNSDDQEVMLQSGTVVELMANSGDRYKTWTCKIIGSCADNLLNRSVNIRIDYLQEHPSSDSFYRPGQQVEIVAEIDFRKKPLQGMKGRVILSTDQEGDVGIEFTEDIGAGSLDGVGKEGHCIYIEASLVKSSE